MAPNTMSSTSSAMEAFNKTLTRSRNERGRRANPGSGFENAGAHVSSRGQIFKVTRRTKVKTVGRSIFSTLALGLKLNKNDPDLGMKLEVVEDVEDEDAMEEIMEQARRDGARKRAEVAAKMAGEDGDGDGYDEADGEEELQPGVTGKSKKIQKPVPQRTRKGQKTRPKRLQRGGAKGRDVVDDDLDAMELTAEVGSGEPDKDAGSPTDGDESDEDEAYRIRIPSRRTFRGHEEDTAWHAAMAL